MSGLRGGRITVSEANKRTSILNQLENAGSRVGLPVLIIGFLCLSAGLASYRIQRAASASTALKYQATILEVDFNNLGRRGQ